MMNDLLFPVTGFRSIGLDNRFPTNPTDLRAGEWTRFPGQYRFNRADSTFGIVAPDDGFLYFTEKNGQQLLLLDLLQPANWQSGQTQAREPMVNALVFKFDQLSNRSVRQSITTHVIQLNMDRSSRIGERDSGGGITSVTDWTTHGTASNAADNFLRVWGTGLYAFRPMVRKGDRIHLFTGDSIALEIGAVYIPRDRSGVPQVADPWYWLDVIELFRRLTVNSIFSSSPISSTPEEGPLKIWYETAVFSGERILSLESSFPHGILYNPPADGREVPSDLIALSSFENERIDAAANASMNWNLQWATEIEGWRDADTTNLGAGTERFFSFSDIGFDFGSRIQPIYIRIRASSGTNSPAVVLRAYRNLIGVARYRARVVMDRRRELEDFLESGNNKYLLTIHNKIELILAMAESSGGATERRNLENLLRGPEDRPDNDRRLAFTVPYGTRTDRLNRAVDRLLEVYSTPLFNQVADHPTNATMIVLKRVHIALHSTATGESGLRERTRGFFNTELVTSGDATPVVTAALFKQLWSRFRSVRESLATSLMDFSKADLYLGVINALNRQRLGAPGSPALVALEAMRDRFITEFGGLEDVQIRTTDFELAPGITVDSFRFETRAAHLSQASSQRAGTVGRIVNTLNLIEDLYKAFVAGAEYNAAYRQRGPFRSIPEFINFVDNAISLTENTIDLYEQWDDRLYVLRSRGANPTSGWRIASRSIGLISGVISLGQIMQDANSRIDQGDHVGAQWLGVAAAGASISLGLSVAAAMAWNPPAAAAIAVGAVILELIGQAGAAAYGYTAVQNDLAHTVFGDDYGSLPGNDEAIRHDWHSSASDHNYTLQIAHLNSHLFPIRNASATIDTSTIPHPTLTIHGEVTSAREGSFVMLQVWDTAWPTLRLNYWFNLEFGAGRTTPDGIPYRAILQSNNTVELEIYFSVAPGSRIAGANMVALGVSLFNSPSLAIRASDPTLTHEQIAALLYEQYGSMSRIFLNITTS